MPAGTLLPRDQDSTSLLSHTLVLMNASGACLLFFEYHGRFASFQAIARLIILDQMPSWELVKFSPHLNAARLETSDFLPQIPVCPDPHAFWPFLLNRIQSLLFILKEDAFVYFICMHAHLREYASAVCRCPWRPEEVGSLGTGVVGSCELPNAGAGDPSWLLSKSGKCRS